MERIKVYVLSSLQSAVARSTGTDGAPSASTGNCAWMLTAGVGPIVVFLVPGDEAPAIVVLVLPGDEAPARAAAFFASTIGRRTGERAGGRKGSGRAAGDLRKSGVEILVFSKISTGDLRKSRVEILVIFIFHSNISLIKEWKILLFLKKKFYR